MAEENASVEATVREIRRKTRKKYSAEEKVRIVLEGLRGESKIAELCRREGIHQNMYYKWSKEFLEAGKQRLVGVTCPPKTDPTFELGLENGDRSQCQENTSPPNRSLAS